LQQGVFVMIVTDIVWWQPTARYLSPFFGQSTK